VTAEQSGGGETKSTSSQNRLPQARRPPPSDLDDEIPF